ncbi:MAG TPA: nitrous oxide-stimulated promoter family protein [Bellilinea sp.]|nr:nitrous oxide-stimulated promoter family protein [Bellilinea sp.]
MNTHPRMDREARTIRAMVRLYCRQNHHTTRELCADCQSLQDYALLRLEKCPFQEGKTTCAKCPVHCYKPDMREKVRQVMRYSGPRMMLRHPLMTVQHLIDGRRKEPVKGLKKAKK